MLYIGRLCCVKENFARSARSLCVNPVHSLHSFRVLLISAGIVFSILTYVVTIRSFVRSPPLIPRSGRGSLSHAVRSFICLFIIRSAIASLHFIRSNKFHSRTFL